MLALRRLENTTLEELGLGFRGACGLGEALQENDFMKKKYLGFNEIKDQGAEALADRVA